MSQVLHEAPVRGGPSCRYNRWSRRLASRDGLRDRFWCSTPGRSVLRDRGGFCGFGPGRIEDPNWRSNRCVCRRLRHCCEVWPRRIVHVYIDGRCPPVDSGRNGFGHGRQIHTSPGQSTRKSQSVILWERFGAEEARMSCRSPNRRCRNQSLPSRKSPDEVHLPSWTGGRVTDAVIAAIEPRCVQSEAVFSPGV